MEVQLSDKAKGFTLIEVVVVMAIIAVLAVLVTVEAINNLSHKSFGLYTGISYLID
ncbi:MAG: hypothetical protein ACD_24C00327G0002 [uncultured bacterium]|nr:MAG: hypothetical protein ACD_24C00327G0002 [uncultured bacterium]